MDLGVFIRSLGIVNVFASAVLQWLIICMAFINAILSFLITNLALYFKVETPCLLCSKLHYILGGKKSKYYWDLICRNHKIEISSLVFCHAHNNLVDVHEMCESCLFSFAAINRSNAETYRLLVGNLGENSSFGSEGDPLLEVQTSCTRHCSCCLELWCSKARGKKLVLNKSLGSKVNESDDSSNRSCSQRNCCLNTKTEPSALPELISLEEVPSSSDARETEESEFMTADNVSLASHTGDSPFATSKDIKPKSNSLETPVRGMKGIYTVKDEGVWQTSGADLNKNFKAGITPATSTEASSETYSISGDNTMQAPLLDISDAYKIAVSNRGKQWTSKDAGRSEDLKHILASHLSAAKEQSLSPRVLLSPRLLLSPRFSLNTDESKTSDLSSTMGKQILQKRNTSESIESGPSLEASKISKPDSENVVVCQKQQIAALYKELEEERSASTIAANQAMAMITRLQEEKAALQMEALHSLRMMEEQAEYDMEALEKTNNLLTEREKEIQDLEEELEYYRNESTLDAIDEGTNGTDNKSLSQGHNRVSSLGSNNDIFFSGRSTPVPPIQGIMNSLVNEVSGLSERLKALEADRNIKTE